MLPMLDMDASAAILLLLRIMAPKSSAAVGADANGYRREFIDLLKSAAALAP